MNDILEEAENAVETKPTWNTWGQVNLTAFECVWPKGSMPIAFDANVHRKQDRKLRIEIVVIPLDEMQARFNTEFKTVADSHDWAAVTLPSIKALGVKIASLDNAWVKITRKPNGKFYAKKDKTTGLATGEKAEMTDFLFLKVFKGQDECLSDYLGESAGDPVDASSADAFPVADAAPAVSSPVAPPASLVTQFAQALVNGAVAKLGKDPAAVTENVRIQIEAAPFFGGKKLAELPEVMAMIMTAVA